MQKTPHSLRPVTAAIWFVTVLAAGYIGFQLRGNSSEPADPKKVHATAAGNVKPSSLAPVGSAGEKPEDGFSPTWPAGVPESGLALRDYVVAVLRNPDPVERQFRYLMLLRAATREQAKALYAGWDLLRKEGSERHECHVPMNFRNGQVDGPATVGTRTGSTYDTSVANAVATQLEGWLSADPEGARTWISGLQDGPFREKMISTYAVSAGLQNLSEAPALIAQLPADIQTAVGNRIAARLRENSGLAAALDTLTTIKTGADGQTPEWAVHGAEDLLEEGLRSRQRAGGVAAAMSERLNLEVVTPERLNAVGRNFATENPTGALEWAAKVEQSGSDKAPPGSLTASLVEAVFEDKLPAVETWIESNPDMPGKDSALMALSLRLSSTDPAKAAQLASQIKDPTLRLRATNPEN